MSYLNAGALPDPNYGDNQLQISDSFFYADFWYRDEFTIPAPAPGRRVWLNFDGINWKADVFFNGAQPGPHRRRVHRGGASMSPGWSARTRPTPWPCVYTSRDTPGQRSRKDRRRDGEQRRRARRGQPGFHATAGWDWIPSIRGRDIGIWSDVYLGATGPVVIERPGIFARLPLPDTSSADLTVEVTLRNAESTARGRRAARPVRRRAL